MPLLHEFHGFEEVTLDEPAPFFWEITEEWNKLDHSRKEPRWLDLAKAADQCGVLPLAKCPWGCSKCFNTINDTSFECVADEHLPQRDQILQVMTNARVPEGV